MLFELVVTTLKGEIIARGKFEAQQQDMPGPWYRGSLNRLPLIVEVAEVNESNS